MVNKIKEIRIGKGISQKELATKLGIKPPTLSQIESSKNPQASTLIKIAEALKCNVSDLIDYSEVVNDNTVAPSGHYNPRYDLDHLSWLLMKTGYAINVPKTTRETINLTSINDDAEYIVDRKKLNKVIQDSVRTLKPYIEDLIQESKKVDNGNEKEEG